MRQRKNKIKEQAVKIRIVRTSENEFVNYFDWKWNAKVLKLWLKESKYKTTVSFPQNIEQLNTY